MFPVALDPVAAGFADSLARPGGNATGFLVWEISSSGTWLELLKEIAPSVKRVAVLRDPALASGTSQFAVIQAAAPSLRMEVSPVNVGDAGIGTVRVAFSKGPTVEEPWARMTSGASAANSTACLRINSALPAPQRDSIRTLRPTVHPSCTSACRNAPTRASDSGSSAAAVSSMPMRLTWSACCARAASGPAAAAPPSVNMNSRRWM